MFPLHGQTKDQTRALVAAAGLTVPLPSESQDICFAPPVAQPGMSAAEAYRPFLERRWQAAGLPQGDVIAPDGLHHNDRGYACLAEALAAALLRSAGQREAQLAAN